MQSIAAGQAVVCNTAAIPNTIRAGGMHERTADLVVTCTGGSPASQQTVPPVQIVVTMSGNAAGRMFTAPWTEALLLIDEPPPGSQLPCNATNAQAFCPMIGSGDGQSTYSGAQGRFNVFQGQRNGNAFQWPSIPFDPPGPERTRVLRFTNLKVNAGGLIAGTISANVAITGLVPVQIANPTRTVANVQTPLQLGPPTAQGGSGQLSGFSLSMLEQFPTVLKTRSIAGADATDQNEPGQAYPGSESGFRNSFFPNVNQRADLGAVGMADTGTRLRIVLNNMPNTISVSAPLTLGNNVARLIHADGGGGGPFEPADSMILANQDGTVAATYEVIVANPFQVETLTASFTFAPAAGAPATPLAQVNGIVQLAPFGGATGMPQPSFSPNTGLPFQVNAPAGPVLSITTSAFPNGFVGAPYNQTLQATGGTPPYTFSLVTANTLPPGLTLAASGAIAGTPTSPGEYRFTARVTDSLQGTATRNFTIAIGNAPPPVNASPRALEYSAALNGAPPPLQAVRIQSGDEKPAFFRVRADGGEGVPAPRWLSVTPAKGKTPARLLVGVDQTGLAEGEYTARILITDPTGSVVLETITVRLKVVARDPELGALPQILRFQTRAGQPEKRREVVILRNGGGGGPIPVTLSLRKGSSWITGVTPSETTVQPWPPRNIAVEIDSAGLAEGFYRDVLHVEAPAGKFVDIPIVLWVAPNAPLLSLSDHGLRFLSRQGERNPIVKRVRVLNKFPNTTLQWNAEAIRGGEWLAISPISGQATVEAPGAIRFGLQPNVANLPIGRRYALVRVSDPAAVHSPQYIVIVLQIAPPGDPPLLDFDSGGIVLISTAGGGRVSRDVQIRTPSASLLPFTLSTSGEGDEEWLSVTPETGSLDVNTTGGAGTITVTGDPSRLAAGLYRGQVVALASGQLYAVNVVFIVTSADTTGASALKPNGERDATCSPKKLAVTQTALVDNFAVPAGWPASLSVELRNDCGAAVVNGSVIASFSNGDPPLSLQSEGPSGVYSATWQPGIVAPQMNVNIRAAAAGLEEATAAMVGAVSENAPPVLYPNGTIHINYHPVEAAGPLAPGMPAEVYGSALATGVYPATQVPLTTNLNGTTVLIGPYEAPLFFASSGQVNVQVPWELQPNRRYSILVIANGEPTTPDFIDVVAVKPGITNTRNEARELIAQHATDFSLVTPQNPAKRGELLVMYLAGLGATDVLVASGAASPGNPPALPQKPVQLTIGGIVANVLFAGMTPGGVGLYQINFAVPDNAPLNTPLDVVVTQDGVQSNVTQLVVAP